MNPYLARQKVSLFFGYLQNNLDLFMEKLCKLGVKNMKLLNILVHGISWEACKCAESRAKTK